MRRLALLLVALAVGGSALAYKPWPKPTLESLAGAWVATDRNDQYRLILTSKGSGCLGMIRPNEEPLLFFVQKLTISGYRVELVLTPQHGSTPALSATGEVVSGHLLLAGKKLFGAAKPSFYREESMSEAKQRLVAAMNGRAE